jgi:hypothetical protein
VLFRSHLILGGQETTDLKNKELQGKWYDGLGNFLALITHKELEMTPAENGCIVQSGVYTDRIFISDKNFEICESDMAFSGKAGVCSKNESCIYLSLIRASSISFEGFSIKLLEGEAAVQLAYENGRAYGYYACSNGAVISVSGKFNDGRRIYVSGYESDDTLHIKLPKGSGTLQITECPPVPETPKITNMVNISGGAEIYLNAQGNIKDGYTIEISSDGGKTWSTHGETEEDIYMIKGLENGKYHVRVSAYNDGVRGKACNELPIYVTGTVPHFPDGLSLKISDNTVKASWGKILGARGYKLYARKINSGEYKLVYEGGGNNCTVKLDGVVSASDEPLKPKHSVIYELAVSAFDGLGESKLSVPVNTDPASWLNWEPVYKIAEEAHEKLMANNDEYERLYFTRAQWYDR